MRDPETTGAQRLAMVVYRQWVYGWLQSFQQNSQQGEGLNSAINGVGTTLIRWLEEYLQVTVWVTMIFLIRVLSLPLFILVVITDVVEGLVRRNLRRYGQICFFYLLHC